MPKGPKGEKRPADVIGAAVKVMRIATGEEEDEKTDDGKDNAAVSLGRRGGKARAAALSAKRRAEIARAAESSAASTQRPARVMPTGMTS
jgi:hypothetical protein